MKPALAVAVAVAALLSLAGAAAAHDGVVHATPEAAQAHAAPATPFPVKLKADFDLIDQTGARRTAADFAGRPMAVFFGYASCRSICTVALPRLGEALDILGPEADGLAAVMITVDPARDTPAALAEKLPQFSPRLIGLTGDEAHLVAARRAFQVETKLVTVDPEGRPIYAHGSFIYLVGPDGLVRTVLPPILSAERLAEIIRQYL